MTPTLATPLPVIIIHHNTPTLLARCLQALQQANQNPTLTLLPVVVDTSPDVARAQARQQVEALSKGYFVTCPNHSLAHAVNTGLRAALPLSDHPALVSMNADVFVRPNAWQPLLTALQPSQVGMVGPVCYDGRGQRQQQGLLYRQHYAHLQLARQVGAASQVVVPWLSGCCQVIKRQALLEVGGMNSSLRFYNEDIEWCWRLRRAGWACHLVDTASSSSARTSSPRTSPPRTSPHCHEKSHAKNASSHAPHDGDTYQQAQPQQQAQPVVHLGGSATPAQTSFVLEGYRGGYRLSQMYRSPLYQTLHRWVLRGLIRQQMMKTPQVVARAGFNTLRQALARGNLFESPFGHTLSEDNPRFGYPCEHTSP